MAGNGERTDGGDRMEVMNYAIKITWVVVTLILKKLVARALYIMKKRSGNIYFFLKEN